MYYAPADNEARSVHQMPELERRLLGQRQARRDGLLIVILIVLGLFLLAVGGEVYAHFTTKVWATPMGRPIHFLG